MRSRVWQLSGLLASALVLLGLSSAPRAAETIVLGGPELAAGIPGNGPLRISEIETWLDDPANHEPLKVELPFGLARSQANIVVPEDNPLTRAKIELGRQLYFDPRLSRDSSVSCASCHHPDKGWGFDTQFGVGIDGQEGGRNSPVSFNRILSGAQFWDGRADSLEAQAIGPIANPIEMGFTHDECVERLREIPGYRLQFDKIFPESGVTIENVGKALASFERIVVTGPSPADYYEPLLLVETQYAELLADLEEFEEFEPDAYDLWVELSKQAEAHPMSDAAKRGRELFFGERANCVLCHSGANFADEQYHNLGVGMEVAEPDLGRFEVTGEERDRGAFKTPTLRNIELTAPYMHDGSQATLEEVVDWYAKGGHPNAFLSDKIKKLDLTDQDRADLVAYMRALTGEFTPVRVDRLPE
ncbi:MAG: c-type cytochrome [Planctomycetales bacterium]|nr:c-type cytochrome [Planctomycetales bacterium]